MRRKTHDAMESVKDLVAQREQELLAEATIEVKLTWLKDLLDAVKDQWSAEKRAANAMGAMLDKAESTPPLSVDLRDTLERVNRPTRIVSNGTVARNEVCETAKVEPKVDTRGRKIGKRGVRKECRGPSEYGAVIALAADGEKGKDIADAADMPVPKVLGIIGRYSENIKALEKLPPGEARYAYLQEWFGWGVGKVKA